MKPIFNRIMPPEGETAKEKRARILADLRRHAWANGISESAVARIAQEFARQDQAGEDPASIAQDRLARQREGHIRGTREAIIADTDVPSELRGANLCTDHAGQPLRVVAETERAHHLARLLVDKWRPGHKGLILAGPSGCGKTYLAAAVMLAILRTRVDDSNAVYRGRMIGAQELNRAIRNAGDAKKEGVGMTHSQIFEAYAVKPHILVWDDLGAEALPEGRPGDWLRDRIEQIIEHRYSKRKTIIATTNLCQEELRRFYGQRILSRLLGWAIWCEMDDFDLRQGDPFAQGVDVDDPFADG